MCNLSPENFLAHFLICSRTKTTNPCVHCTSSHNQACGGPIKFLTNCWVFNQCPVHLPGQNIFCTGQNNFCPRQNIFVPDKNFCPRLKSSYLLGKRIENDFKLWRNFFPWLKSYFPSISQAKMYFLA